MIYVIINIVISPSSFWCTDESCQSSVRGVCKGYTIVRFIREVMMSRPIL